MKKSAFLLFAIIILWHELTYSAEGELGVRISQQQNQLRQTPVAFIQQELYLHLQQRMWTMKVQALAAQQVAGNYSNNKKSAINELYVNFLLGDIEGSIGKKVLSWGVGYGYRPLDVIQRESRQELRTFDLEGVPLLELDYFTAESAVTLIVSNRVHFDGISLQKGDYESALKYSTLLGNNDVHLLLYQRQGEGGSVGSGISATDGEHLEWHASIRNLPANSYPNGFSALLGASWTWKNAYSLMLEAWHDEVNINKQQSIHVDNIIREILFMRLSYDGDSLEPNLSLLYNHADGGMVWTAAADYDWHDNITLFASARVLGGKQTSAVNNAADRWQLFIGLQLGSAL